MSRNAMIATLAIAGIAGAYGLRRIDENDERESVTFAVPILADATKPIAHKNAKCIARRLRQMRAKQERKTKVQP